MSINYCIKNNFFACVSGISVSIFSYAGEVRIGVMSDKNLLTNPEAFVEQFVKKVYSLAKELNMD